MQRYIIRGYCINRYCYITDAEKNRYTNSFYTLWTFTSDNYNPRIVKMNNTFAVYFWLSICNKHFVNVQDNLMFVLSKMHGWIKKKRIQKKNLDTLVGLW